MQQPKPGETTEDTKDHKEKRKKWAPSVILCVLCGSRLFARFHAVDFLFGTELFSAYTGKEGDPTYMKSSDGSSSRSREVAEA